ncbi:MAG: hypothetical protein ABSF10_15855 [Verrucomicrobiota bacterium]|jgi:hypothetical protein
MKPLKTIPFLLLFALLALWASGCASQNVNPPQARANTGYVDFHADSAGELYWQVERFDDRTQSFKNVFSTFDPLPDKVLRLAFVPGHYRLQVTFLNRVITQPAEVEVEVQAGKITPVRVVLTSAGTTQVETKEVSRGGTIRGHYGRRTRLGSDETVMYGLSAVADPPMPYQVKERMPYEH